MVVDSALPSPPGFWSGPWVRSEVVAITPEDVAGWLYSVGVLFRFAPPLSEDPSDMGLWWFPLRIYASCMSDGESPGSCEDPSGVLGPSDGHAVAHRYAVTVDEISVELGRFGDHDAFPLDSESTVILFHWPARCPARTVCAASPISRVHDEDFSMSLIICCFSSVPELTCTSLNRSRKLCLSFFICLSLSLS